MKRLLLIALLAFILAACGPVVIVVTPTPELATPTESTLTVEASATAEASSASPGPTATMETSATLTPTALSTPTPSPTPAPTIKPADNLLLCWGFECGWRYQADDPNGGLKVPLTWTAFWRNSVPQAWGAGIPDSQRLCNGFLPAVELQQHPANVKEGAYSARVIEAGRNCPAGLYQQVDAVTPGATYLASAYLWNWSTDNPVVDSPSTSWTRSWIGVDPMGGTDPFAASVAWSAEESARDRFAYLEVKAKAQGTRLTVFLLSIPNYAVARSDSFWDITGLLELAPPPTATAFATPTPIAAQGIVELGTAVPPPPGLGALKFSVSTNLRDCGSQSWDADFDPTVSCQLLLTDEGAYNIIPPGSVTQVQQWRRDRYGNIWAWYGSLSAVACYKGAARGDFYPGIGAEQAAGGKDLPAPVNPCSLIGG